MTTQQTEGTMKPSDRLTVAQLCEEWDTNAVQIWRWRNIASDPLPTGVRRIGRTKVFFIRKDVEAWRKRNLEAVK